MNRKYSPEIGKRLLKLKQEGVSIAELARRYSIHRHTVTAWQERAEREQGLPPGPRTRARKIGYTVEQQAASDAYSRRLLHEYRTEDVPLRVLAKRHGERTSAIGRRVQRAREMERRNR